MTFRNGFIIFITEKVSIANKIRRKIRLLLKQRALRRYARKRHVVSYALAKHFAVLYEMEPGGGFASIRPIVKQLQTENKKLSVVAYYPQKRMPEALDVPEGVACVVRKDFSLLMRPKNEALRQFLNKEYDILIDLSSHQAFPMKMLAAMTPATYKVGAHHPDYVDIYDLILDVKDNFTASELAKHVIHYLKIIKTPGEHDRKI